MRNEQSTELYKMIQEIVEIKDERIKDLKRQLGEYLQQRELNDGYYFARPEMVNERIDRLKNKIILLEENKQKFRTTFNESGFLIDN